MASCDICLTDPYYFIPAFVELTSSNVEENRRLILEHGIAFPLGKVYFHGVTMQIIEELQHVQLLMIELYLH